MKRVGLDHGRSDKITERYKCKECGSYGKYRYTMVMSEVETEGCVEVVENER